MTLTQSKFLGVLFLVLLVSPACAVQSPSVPAISAPAGTPEVTSAALSSPLPAISPQAHISGELTVFAATSLIDAFTDLGNLFKVANPNVIVAFNFAASTALFTQIDQGARADVFASADQVQMDRAKTAGHIDGPDRVIATNRLVVITPAANPGNVKALADLAKPGLKVVTSQADVPIGNYTQAIFDKMSQSSQYGSDFKDRVNANIVSREANVRQIVAKVQLGEADAGVVYQTDLTPRSAPQLARVEVPDDLNTLASYPIGKVKDAPNAAAADAFVAFVMSPSGQATLAKWNFIPSR